jgi:hypothetical protein
LVQRFLTCLEATGLVSVFITHVADATTDTSKSADAPLSIAHVANTTVAMDANAKPADAIANDNCFVEGAAPASSRATAAADGVPAVPETSTPAVANDANAERVTDGADAITNDGTDDFDAHDAGLAVPPTKTARLPVGADSCTDAAQRFGSASSPCSTEAAHDVETRSTSADMSAPPSLVGDDGLGWGDFSSS